MIFFKGKFDCNSFEKTYQVFNLKEGRTCEPPAMTVDNLLKRGWTLDEGEALVWLIGYIKNDLVRDLTPGFGVKTLTSELRQNFALPHIGGFHLSIMTFCMAVIDRKITMTKAELKAKLPPLVRQVHAEDEQLFFDAMTRLNEMAGKGKEAQK